MKKWHRQFDYNLWHLIKLRVCCLSVDLSFSLFLSPSLVVPALFSLHENYDLIHSTFQSIFRSVKIELNFKTQFLCQFLSVNFFSLTIHINWSLNSTNAPLSIHTKYTYCAHLFKIYWLNDWTQFSNSELSTMIDNCARIYTWNRFWSHTFCLVMNLNQQHLLYLDCRSRALKYSINHSISKLWHKAQMISSTQIHHIDDVVQ